MDHLCRVFVICVGNGLDVLGMDHLCQEWNRSLDDLLGMYYLSWEWIVCVECLSSVLGMG